MAHKQGGEEHLDRVRERGERAQAEELKKSEHQAKKSEIRYQSLYELSPFPLIQMDCSGLVRPIQKQVLGTETPAELMKDLEMTGSDLEFPEFDQLKNEVKGL